MVYQIEEINLSNSKRWNNLLLNSLYPVYNRSIEYAHAQELNNRITSTFIFSQNGKDVAGVHYFLKSSMKGWLSVADILSGITFREEPNSVLLTTVLEHFIKWAHLNNADFVRINPWLPFYIKGVKTSYANLIEEEIHKVGFKLLERGRQSYWVNLENTEEELIASMKPQTRRHLRKTIYSSIRVDTHNFLTNELLDTFWNLYSQRGIEKNFKIMDQKRFNSEIKALMDPGLATLFLLYCQGKLINIALTSNFGVATYYHGAIAPDYMESKDCPSPGYAAQWAIIKYLKEKGVKIYDMAFCPGPVPLKGHPKFDIWRFKYGFGGDHVEFMPVYGKILHPVKGRVFNFLRYIRK